MDQLNIIGRHLYELKTGEEFIDVEDDAYEAKINFVADQQQNPTISTQPPKKKLGTQFTRTQLKKREDWPEWHASEIKQLDLYEMQNMSGVPIPRPPKANVLNLLWTYLIKAEGTKKARCVCNGNPRRKGTVTLAYTFAACLEQPGARTFWATAAINGMIVMGADASNAFAEAPPPKAPLYVVVDQQFREWWKSKVRGEIEKSWVLPVKHALQGHPESPQLWAAMIDKIIREDVGQEPCTHEPCLYHGYVEGKQVLFLR